MFGRKHQAARDYAQASMDHNRYDTRETLRKAREASARADKLGVTPDDVGAQVAKLRGRV